MKLTKRIKTTILVYANLAAAMVGIGAFTYTTLAWFAQNLTRQVHMESVRVTIPGFAVTGFDCYEVTNLVKGETNTAITFSSQTVTSLATYDPQWKMNAAFSPAIVVHVQFTYDAAEIVTFSATTDHTTFSSGTTGSGETDDNYASNAFQITPTGGPYSGLGESWTSAILNYTNADSDSFVTIGATPSKVTSLDLAAINPGDTETWFVLEYSQAVMDYIDNARIGNDRDVIYHDDIVYLVA